MSEAVVAQQPRVRRWLPFGDRSRPRRLAKVAAWLVAIALALAVLELLGVDVLGWFSDLWDALTGIGLGYLVAGWTLQTAQTTLTAFGWYSILRQGGRARRTRLAGTALTSLARVRAHEAPCSGPQIVS
jgi:uncharacterized membrane protein YbhN (UPF0104 family)